MENQSQPDWVIKFNLATIASFWDYDVKSFLVWLRLAFTKSIAYKLSRDFSFSSFPGA